VSMTSQYHNIPQKNLDMIEHYNRSSTINIINIFDMPISKSGQKFPATISVIL